MMHHAWDIYIHQPSRFTPEKKLNSFPGSRLNFPIDFEFFSLQSSQASSNRHEFFPDLRISLFSPFFDVCLHGLAINRIV